jgi:hypothetical protein
MQEVLVFQAARLAAIGYGLAGTLHIQYRIDPSSLPHGGGWASASVELPG